LYAKSIKRYSKAIDRCEDMHHMPTSIQGLIETERIRQRVDYHNYEHPSALAKFRRDNHANAVFLTSEVIKSHK